MAAATGGILLGGRTDILHNTSFLFQREDVKNTRRSRRMGRVSVTMQRLVDDDDSSGSEGDSINLRFLDRRGFVLAGIYSFFPLLQPFKTMASEDFGKDDYADLQLPITTGRVQTLTVRTDLGRKQRKYIRGGVTTGDENAPLMSILDQENVNEVAIDERNSLVPKSVQDFATMEKEGLKKNDSVEEGPINNFISLLNAVGIVGSGVLAALYAISQKDKSTIESSIESMKSKLDEKEEAVKLLNDNYERTISTEREENKQKMKELNDFKSSLSKQLVSANATINTLEEELQVEKSSVESLNLKVDFGENQMVKAEKEKKILQSHINEKINATSLLEDRVTLLSLEIQDKERHIEELSTTLSEKELECNNIKSTLERSRSDHEKKHADVKNLTVELLQTKEELESKNQIMAELDEKIESLLEEKNEASRKLNVLHDDYRNLKSMSAKKTDLDSKLLLEKNSELQHLEGKLNSSLDEAKRNRTLIPILMQERDDCKAKLKYEAKKVKNLKSEVDITLKRLEDSNLENANLSRLLKQSEATINDLKSELSKAQKDINEADELTKKILNDVKSTSLDHSNELIAIKDTLDSTRQELSTTSDELKIILKANEILKKELLAIYKKSESTANNLVKERILSAELRKELGVSEKQVLQDSQVIAGLVKDLDEAKTSILRELEFANSTIANLKEEKMLMYNSLLDERKMSEEARENIEDAQKLIIRLGDERENLSKRVSKLEEELASAKCEILRLRRQYGRSSRKVVEENVDATGSVAENKNSGRGGRRKKGGEASIETPSAEIVSEI